MFGKKEEEIQIDMELFMMYDAKVNSFEGPAFAINHLDMLRQLGNLFQDPGQAQNKYLLNAEDYAIYRIGSLNKKSGTFIVPKRPEHIADLRDIKAMAPQKGISPT